MLKRARVFALAAVPAAALADFGINLYGLAFRTANAWARRW
jgi:hypothetical protein